jgi:hypothetical protein
MRTTVDLAYDYKVHIIAPDEAKGRGDEPAWQFLFEGTADKLNMSSAVDKGWSQVEEALKKLYEEYEDSIGIKTIELGRYRLCFTRPDKNESEPNEPIWKLQIIDGGSRLAEEGLTFYDRRFEALFADISSSLYRHVGSGVLDEKLHGIEDEFRKMYDKYHENQTTDTPS